MKIETEIEYVAMLPVKDSPGVERAILKFKGSYLPEDVEQEIRSGVPVRIVKSNPDSWTGERKASAMIAALEAGRYDLVTLCDYSRMRRINKGKLEGVNGAVGFVERYVLQGGRANAAINNSRDYYRDLLKRRIARNIADKSKDLPRELL